MAPKRRKTTNKGTAFPSRKGQVRKKSANITAVEQAGDPNYPKTFLEIKNNEQKVAGYLGYTHTSDLRRVAVSWPVLRALADIEPIATQIRRTNALILINDNAAKYKQSRNPSNKFPILDGMSAKEKKTAKDRQLAAILSNLVDDLDRMSSIGQDENKKLHETHLEEFNDVFSSLSPGLVKYFSPTTDNGHSVKAPVMGPLENESALEVSNRAWQLLKYCRETNQSGNFNKRFDEGLINGVKVSPVYVPAWMRPKKDPASRDVGKSTPVEQADKLPQKQFSILWDKVLQGGDDVLSPTIADARKNKIIVPSVKQKFQIDPRVFNSEGALRDAIRRQYNCEEIGMNIELVELDYCVVDDNTTITHNMSMDDFSTIKSALDDTNNDKFEFRVAFKPLEDPSEYIYESFEPLPTFAEFVEVKDGDVGQNLFSSATRAGAAFPNTSAQSSGTGVASSAARTREDIFRSFVDEALGQDDASPEIGEAPDPKKKFPDVADQEAMLAYYDGHDVTTEEGMRSWQRKLFTSVIKGGVANLVTADKLPNNISDEHKNLISDANFLGSHMAQSLEGNADQQNAQLTQASVQTEQDRAYVEEQKRQEADRRYFNMKIGHSGTQAQAGPPLDLCLQLLDCEEHFDENGNRSGFYVSNLLKGITKTKFFPWQISGGVGMALKLYGSIDPEKLIAATRPYSEGKEAQICDAAAQLRNLMLHGCILADDVGFGKTKQMLLLGVFHTILNDDMDPEDPAKVLYKPILLDLPPALINQWIEEIIGEWPYFTPIISYAEHSFSPLLDPNTLPHTAMKEYPNLDSTPNTLRWMFDPADPRAGRAIIVTSYDTHKSRTCVPKDILIPGVPHDPPVTDQYTGEVVWKRRPRTKRIWLTAHEGTYSLFLGDEAQKVKNYTTGVWASVYNQSFRKTVLATATPMYNSIRDLLGFMGLIWPMALIELNKYLEDNEEARLWLKELDTKSLDLLRELDNIPADSPLQLAAADPKMLSKATSHRHTAIHTSVLARVRPIVDLLMIRRSPASILPVSVGEPVSLRPLFKRINRRTAICRRRPDEDVEYQFFHREAAREYMERLKPVEGMEQNGELPQKPADVKRSPPFTIPTGPLRKLAMATFSTKMARLNAMLSHFGGNTHVKTLQSFREEGREAEFIYHLTRGPTEIAETASELVHYLVQGSPVMRQVFQELYQIKAIEPLDKKKYQAHQKLILGEVSPANAYFVQCVLRAAGVDARVLHSGLSNKGKSDMVKLFNDPTSRFKCIIMMYDVGAVGLNLHHACNRVLMTSPARAFAQEEQLAGRALRCVSEFGCTVTRCENENSHDDFRSMMQADKATVQLAANAHVPEVQSLILEYLQELQPEIDQCHTDPEALQLKEDLERRRREEAIARAAEPEQAQSQEPEVKSEVQSVNAEPVSLAVPTARQLRTRSPGTRAPALDNICEECSAEIDPQDRLECEDCARLIHYQCHGLIEPEDDWRCDLCDLRRPSEEELERQSDADDFEMDEDDEDEEYSEDFLNVQVGRTFRQQEQAEKYFEPEDLLNPADSFSDFASETQPEEAVRRNLVLLSLPYQHTWTREDLRNEYYLRIGLLILHNKIQGRDRLTVHKSIHINYTKFPPDSVANMTTQFKVSDEQRKALRNYAPKA